MLTSPVAVRPAYRSFDAEVSGIRELGPHFLRVTFAGAELEHFGTDGLDQRVKIVFPHPRSVFADFPAGEDWYSGWRALPTGHRNDFRTYTVRAVRPWRAEVDVDFVVHGIEFGEPGPAARWLAAAAPGNPVVIIGPDARSPHSASGIDWRPGNARTLLIAGDETAAPAITAILESLPADAAGAAFIEVPEGGDQLAVSAPAGVAVRWLPRHGAEHGVLLDEAVRAWVTGRGLADQEPRASRAPIDETAGPDEGGIMPDGALLWESSARAAGELYAWVAGEASVVTSIRRFLVRESGLDRRSVAFMGYWRAGRPEL